MGHGARRGALPEQGTLGRVNGSVGVRVVGGYLGAGKTTLINALLRASGDPIAVVVNDFGSVNIDAVLIAERHDDVIELTNGCICCAVGDSLADTLYSILERPRRPSGIVIEASGVADPGVLAGYGHLHGLHTGGTIVLIDAVNAGHTRSHPLLARTFERQVAAADILCITKTDIATPLQLDEALGLLRALAPGTPIVAADPTAFATLLERPIDPVASVGDPGVPHDDHRSDLLPADACATEAEWHAMLEAMPDTCVRAKGIILLADGTRRLLQVVGRHVELTPTDAAPTGVVVIHVGDPQ